MELIRLGGFLFNLYNSSAFYLEFIMNCRFAYEIQIIPEIRS